MENLIVEPGEDRSRVLVAFTGFGGALGTGRSTFEFLGSTGMLSASRILLRDPSKKLYFHGIPGGPRSFPDLIDLIRQHIAELRATEVLCVGSSGGGYAALLAGHMLRADSVEAFAPPTNVHILSLVRARDWELMRHWRVILGGVRLPRRQRRNLDLTSVLAEWNGHTRYRIHVCERRRADVRRAEQLSGCANVTIVRHDCNQHQVGRFLARKRELHSLFARVPAGAEHDPAPRPFEDAGPKPTSSRPATQLIADGIT
jgi:hypothetical protein